MVSFPVLLAGTLAIGWWIGKQVEESVVHRIGSVTALYVDAFVGPHVQSLTRAPALSKENMVALDGVLRETMLGQKIISLKVWDKTGRVLYSTDPTVIGKKFPIEEGLEIAITGAIFSEISVRSTSGQIEHGQPLPRLIETYTPIHEDHTGTVIAVAEFYERPDELDRLAGQAQRSSWLRVAGAMIAMYFILFLLVRSGSQTIDAQQSELSDQVQQLTELNSQNLKLQERVIKAAERTTLLNENFLKRVSADIHDGPGQDLGFALMQLKNMDDVITDGGVDKSGIPAEWAKGLNLTKIAIDSALKDLRGMSADIELPDVARLGLTDIAARVVRDLQVKTGSTVELVVRGEIQDVSYRIKVAVYRLLQESLANTVRHAAGAACRVTLSADAHTLRVEICDQGPGFNVAVAANKGRLGLRGMRQRVEVLGGSFDLITAIGAGTSIRVALPLALENEDYE